MDMLRNSIFFILLLAALFFLQFRLWFQSGGIADVLRYKKLLAQQSSENAVLRKHNDQLLQQIQRIQHSQDATEARARSELGMVKDGETFYQVVR